MQLSAKQMLAIIASLPDGKPLPHDTQHTVNAADLTGILPPGFITGKHHIVFTWSKTLGDWHFVMENA